MSAPMRGARLKSAGELEGHPRVVRRRDGEQWFRECPVQHPAQLGGDRDGRGAESKRLQGLGIMAENDRGVRSTLYAIRIAV